MKCGVIGFSVPSATLNPSKLRKNLHQTNSSFLTMLSYNIYILCNLQISL